jgi:hypothetical protein
VYGLLADVRARVNALWARLSAHNREHPIVDSDKIKVTFYLGQNIEQSDPELDARTEVLRTGGDHEGREESDHEGREEGESS